MKNFKPIMFLIGLIIWIFFDTRMYSVTERTYLLEFKIKNIFFEYKKSNQYLNTEDYDDYLISKNYSIEKITMLIENRKDSRYYNLMNFLNNKNDIFLSQNDIDIINSLRKFILNPVYKKELLKNKNKIYNRIKEIKEVSIFNIEYKNFLLKELEK